MSPESVHPDPFSLTANPGLYVRREATDEALARLERGIEQNAGCAVLVGPAGIGKTLLLRVLGERLRHRFHVVHLPYPALPPAALCRWALQILGEPGGEDPEAALGAFAARELQRGRPVVLLVDDADAMPEATLKRLGELLLAARRALRLVMTSLDEAEPDWGGALGFEPARASLASPMSPEETTRYVRSRLEASGVSSDLWRRFDAPTLAWLQRESGGVPVRIHEYATALLRRGTGPPPSAVASASAGPVVPDGGEPESVPDDTPGAEPSRADLAPPVRSRSRGRPWGLAFLTVFVLGLVGIGLLRSGVPWPNPDGDRGAPTPRAQAVPPEPSPVPPARAATISALPVAVNLNASPWAEIEIDGLAVGLTPLAGVPLPPGRHVFRARMPDGRVLERSVFVGPENRHVTFE